MSAIKNFKKAAVTIFAAGLMTAGVGAYNYLDADIEPGMLKDDNAKVIQQKENGKMEMGIGGVLALFVLVGGPLTLMKMRKDEANKAEVFNVPHIHNKSAPVTA